MSMLAPGVVQQIAFRSGAPATADAAGDLPPTRLMGPMPLVNRVGLFISIAGAAGVTATLRPVFVLRDPAGTEEQFENNSQEVTVGGTAGATPYRTYREIDCPAGFKFGLRITAVTGAPTEVKVMACQGAGTLL